MSASPKHSHALLPGATLGVMGGGQLGRMFVHAAQRMGYFTAVLEPDKTSPAALVSHYPIQTHYLDEQGLAQLMQRCDAITTEFENVPAQALHTLGAHRPVAPSAQAVAVAQDRVQEKLHFGRCAVACAPYAVIESAADVAHVDTALFPAVLKTARSGYDGKGQLRLASAQALQAAWTELGQVPCVLEQQQDLALELSVILARGRDGQMVHYAPQRNVHRSGILAVTEALAANAPAPAYAQQAVQAAQTIAQTLDYVGVLCVEFFVLADGRLLANEMAPRPHNSGHYTLDACDVSQFELQVRTLCGLPLTAPRQHSAAVMLNLLGDLWTHAAPDWARILTLPGAHLHLYGKLQARPGRKMGHLTLTGPDAASVLTQARLAAQWLGIAPW